MMRYSWLFLWALVLLSATLQGQLPSSAKVDAASSVSVPDFPYSQGWLGADDAYSIPISPNRSLWLFGDTFVGTPKTQLRNQSKTMVRNSVGISDCRPGHACTIRYFWNKPNDPKPRSFFDTGTDDLWYWPLDADLSGDTLYVSLLAVRNKPGSTSKDAFGFEIAGTKLATISNAHDSPPKWRIRVTDLSDSRLWLGVSIVPEHNELIWYTQVSEGEGHGFMTAVRVARDKVGELPNAWEHLNQNGQWVSGLPGSDAAHVIDQAISEMSVRYHPSIKKWIALSTGPEFPSPRAVIREADSPIGPWSKPQTIFEIPEMKSANPGYDKDTFCYAVKEHVEFADDKIVLTYACNSMVLKKTMDNMLIYRPKVVVLDLPK
ncbi:MAG TPA: DUF4185 domain-containing protein [Terriglobales bacterium]|nr:DUF4185 domain-containing protein [Terriglobales bacterium]